MCGFKAFIHSSKEYAKRSLIELTVRGRPQGILNRKEHRKPRGKEPQGIQYLYMQAFSYVLSRSSVGWI